MVGAPETLLQAEDYIVDKQKKKCLAEIFSFKAALAFELASQKKRVDLGLVKKPLEEEKVNRASSAQVLTRKLQKSSYKSYFDVDKKRM